MDPKEELSVIKAIRNRLDILEMRCKQKIESKGGCLCTNLQQISDLSTMRSGYRYYKCQDCNRVIRKKLD